MYQNVMAIHPTAVEIFNSKLLSITDSAGGKVGGGGVRVRDDHECLYKIPWQSIQYLLRYFSLDQNGGLTEPTDIHRATWLKSRYK